MRAAVVGVAGPALLDEEAALFRAAPPAGAILFARNVVDPAQLRALTDALRRVLPEGAVILVDQEGGRVARLRPPHWRAHPPAALLGALHGEDPAAGLLAAWLTGALIGLDCAAAGICVACAPVLDLRVPGAHDVIGDRSFGPDPDAVARLGRAMAEGLMAAGVQPVGKHAPGHGRAGVDSHWELPRVDAGCDLDADLRAFAHCSDLPWMMTAHILYAGLDPERPGTLSPRVIHGVIRGRIGFQGVLVSDDLAMHALGGTPGEAPDGAPCAAVPPSSPGALAPRAIEAGCDLALHCTGRLEETAAVLRACPDLDAAGRRRLEVARDLAATRRRALDARALAAERDGLLAGPAWGTPAGEAWDPTA